MAMAFCCVFGSTNSIAGQELDAVNAQVEQHVQKMDLEYGIWVDPNDRIQIKLDYIVKHVLSKRTADDQRSAKELAEVAYTTFNITDFTQRVQLLNKFVAQESTGQGGTRPDYP